MNRRHRTPARVMSAASAVAAPAPLRRPGAVGLAAATAAPVMSANKTRRPVISRGTDPMRENADLYAYEQRVKQAFDQIVPTLKQISALQHEADFEQQAQQLAQKTLGFRLPEEILETAWVEQLDMKKLFAWCTFETYRRYCEDFFSQDPLGQDEAEFNEFLQSCGFHTLDVSPCADGRLAHVIRYVLRLPYRAVRRKSYAGALFDIEDSLSKWIETEMSRYREGVPNLADAPTRYLKTVVYHYSSQDPHHEGCAAHGSDDAKAAQAGLDHLVGFQEAVENGFCCGASIDLMLVGLDTDTDAIRIHVVDAQGEIDLSQSVDARVLMHELGSTRSEAAVVSYLEQAMPDCADGMRHLMARLLVNNFAQIEYVRQNHGGNYPDMGHAERFIGAGIGFEEVQLRNLTYFAYLQTVEEAAADLDVGIKIFTGLNVRRGLPIPVVIRFDYHGEIPGARERAVEHCERIQDALQRRYPDLVAKGLLHTLQVTRDCTSGGQIELHGCSVRDALAQGGH
jgi:carboxysome shell carbonic anhydrase